MNIGLNPSLTLIIEASLHGKLIWGCNGSFIMLTQSSHCCTLSMDDSNIKSKQDVRRTTPFIV